MKARASNADPPKRELLAHDARGEFSDEVKDALRTRPALLKEIADHLLEHHFPESLHPDILSAVGFGAGTPSALARKRDRQFRQRVLTAYEYRCAVCGFDVRLGSVAIVLAAAHIQWHQASGPDQESNGLALCVLRHKTFDLGAFTLDPTGVLLVSDLVHGTAGFEDVLLRHHGRRVRTPRRPEWHPAAGFLGWHRREVFKGAARHV
jgi:putative restriction endonuclease